MQTPPAGATEEPATGASTGSRGTKPKRQRPEERPERGKITHGDMGKVQAGGGDDGEGTGLARYGRKETEETHD